MVIPTIQKVVALHQCPHCSYYTPHKRDMRRHHLVHTGEKPFGCPYCQHRSARKENLTAHIRTKHGPKADLPGAQEEEI
ncbi:hypothetical protein SK128_013802 [Halocaridina rubra]|uniref:C2H2-type domain-containing protein n=1 Tax=Halocaridina rubra TaxID=373956 RepID=A0AAN8WFZ9_HALRR